MEVVLATLASEVLAVVASRPLVEVEAVVLAGA